MTVLHLTGIPVEAALAATLLLRGFTPGYRCCRVSRRCIANRAEAPFPEPLKIPDLQKKLWGTILHPIDRPAVRLDPACRPRNESRSRSVAAPSRTRQVGRDYEARTNTGKGPQ